ncbi:MAG: BON domain-containing protein [Alphaproteobacteria bacterium]|nr:BON domain-containing protein [Alphaproteobacteria bacterium]
MSVVKSFAKSLVVPTIVLSLVSCAVFEGRQTAGRYVDDATITTKVKAAFIEDPIVKAMQINVETMEGVVQLSGFVDSSESEARAVRLAQQVNGVKRVQDDIIVRRR